MSVREYIGARYVPLFADPLTWDATRTYEPLTVVLYQGNSYTSRQAVPANIDITNTTYWAQTGNYNAQVEQYRAEVQTFDGRISDIEDTIPVDEFSSSDTVKDYIDKKAADINAIIPSSAFNSTNTVKKYIDTRVNERVGFGDRKYILLGDSFGGGIYPLDDGSGNYGYSNHGWINSTKAILNSRGCQVWSNVDAIVAGNSGFTSTAKFVTMVRNLYDNVIENPNEVSDIVVIAGTNDRGVAEATVTQAVVDFVNTCRTLYPNAMVRIGCLGTHVSSGLRSVSACYKNGAQQTGAHFISSLYNLFTDPTYISSDNVHLTVNGYAFYKQYIIEAAIYGDTYYEFNTRITPSSIDNGWSIDGDFRIDFIRKPEGTYVNIGNRAGNMGFTWYRNNTPDANKHTVTITLPNNTPELPQYNVAFVQLQVKANITLASGTVIEFTKPCGGVYFENETTLKGYNVALPSGLLTSQQFWINRYQMFYAAM